MTSAAPRADARLTAGLALLSVLLLSTAPAARAHDALVDSEPRTGAALDAGPAFVRLDFAADVLTVGAAIIVADDAGTPWQDGEPVLDGSSVSVPLLPDLPDGTYEVRWRVVSSDGHPISGLIPFMVGDVAPATPTDATAAPDFSTGASVARAVDPDDRAASSPWRTVAVGAGGAVLSLGLYGLVVLLRRRDRHPDVASR